MIFSDSLSDPMMCGLIRNGDRDRSLNTIWLTVVASHRLNLFYLLLRADASSCIPWITSKSSAFTRLMKSQNARSSDLSFSCYSAVSLWKLLSSASINCVVGLNIPAMISGWVGSNYWASKSIGYILDNICFNLIVWYSKNGDTMSMCFSFFWANEMTSLSPLNLIARTI